MEENYQVENDIFKNHMHNQFSKFQGFDFNNIDKLRKQIEDGTKLTYLPSYKKILPADKNASILELGTGFGRFACFCNMLGYRNYIGVDLSVDGTKTCKKLLPNYNFINDEVANYLTNTEEQYDFIFIEHVLEHVKKEKIPEVLDLIRMHLTDKGVVVITVPNGAAYFGSGAARYIDFTHEISFTPESLEEILFVRLFSDVKSYNMNVSVPFYKRWAHNLAKIILEIFLSVMGYKNEKIYTSTFFTIAKK